jgi:hypothetical protein
MRQGKDICELIIFKILFLTPALLLLDSYLFLDTVEPIRITNFFE